MATVVYFGALREIAGAKEQETDADTVRALLKQIKRQYGGDAYRLAKRSHIIVDGKNAALTGGFSTALHIGSTVQLLPVCGGG